MTQRIYAKIAVILYIHFLRKLGNFKDFSCVDILLLLINLESSFGQKRYSSWAWSFESMVGCIQTLIFVLSCKTVELSDLWSITYYHNFHQMHWKVQRPRLLSIFRPLQEVWFLILILHLYQATSHLKEKKPYWQGNPKLCNWGASRKDAA